MTSSHKKFSNISNYTSSIKKSGNCLNGKHIPPVQNAYSKSYQSEDVFYCPELEKIIKNNAIPCMGILPQVAFPLRPLYQQNTDDYVSNASDLKDAYCDLIALERPEFKLQSHNNYMDYVDMQIDVE